MLTETIPTYTPLLHECKKKPEPVQILNRDARKSVRGVSDQVQHKSPQAGSLKSSFVRK